MCPRCFDDCGYEWLDYGIGPYEYCGYRGVDTQWRSVCRGCELSEEAVADYRCYRCGEEVVPVRRKGSSRWRSPCCMSRIEQTLHNDMKRTVRIL